MSDKRTPMEIRLGWVPVSWSGAKRPCRKCGRKVRAGTVHVSEEHANPPTNVLCHWCVREIMQAGRPENLN